MLRSVRVRRLMTAPTRVGKIAKGDGFGFATPDLPGRARLKAHKFLIGQGYFRVMRVYVVPRILDQCRVPP